MVIWVIGLSGAGKTTIGHKLYEKIKENHRNTVFLDGDIIRNLMADNLGFSKEERKKSAQRTHNLCRMMDSQDINVVCCILSNQPKIREMNRRCFKQYYEIFVDVSLEILMERDSKGLYKKVQDGEISNVVGVDIPFIPPRNPNAVIDNNEFVDLDDCTDEILEHIPDIIYDYGEVKRNEENKTVSRINSIE